MTPEQWLEFNVNLESDMHLGLDHVRDMADALGIDSPSSTIISVAGTNGKGSTVATLEAIYTHAGITVGSFTSPHLLNFNERIKLNSKAVENARICESFERIKENLDAALPRLSASYFEYAVLAAMLIFKQAQPEVIILEVGVGGRLDATNAWKNDCAIITHIGLDHQHILGDTTEAIAQEKAGIINPESDVILGDVAHSEIFKHLADMHGAQLHHYGHHFYVEPSSKIPASDSLFTICINDPRPASQPTYYQEVHTPLSGLHQRHNTALAVSAIHQLNVNGKVPISNLRKAINGGLATVKIKARIQTLCDEPHIIIDVAHNQTAVDALFKSALTHTKTKTQAREAGPNNVHVLFSALADKDISRMLSSAMSAKRLHKLDFHWHIAPLNHPRAASIDQLQKAMPETGDKVNYYDNYQHAIDSVVNLINSEDLWIVFGSFVAVTVFLDYYIDLNACDGLDADAGLNKKARAP